MDKNFNTLLKFIKNIKNNLVINVKIMWETKSVLLTWKSTKKK